MYRVELSSKARKGYETYLEYREKFDLALDALQSNACPYHDFDLVKLGGLKYSYRIRLGKMRLKYAIFEEEHAILVFYLGPRQGAYD